MRRALFVRLGMGLVMGVCALMIIGCAKPKPPDEIPITTTSDEARQLYKKALDVSDNGAREEAMKLVDEMLKKDPDFALAYALKATLGGGFAKSREAMEKAQSLVGKVTPGERLLIHYRAAGLEGSVGTQKIILDSLAILFPADKRVPFMTGLYYYFHGDFKKSLEYLKKATAIDSSFAAAYNQIAYTCMDMGDFDGAESAFKTYIRLVPNQPNPYDSYAEFLMKRGRFDESIEQYKKALEKSSAFISSLLGIGHDYVFKGEYARGREYYDKYAENPPDYTYNLDRLYWTGVSYIHEGKIPEALKAFQQQRQAAEKENSIPAVLSAMGNEEFTDIALGNHSNGLKKCQEMVELAGSSKLPPALRENMSLGNKMGLGFAYLRCNMAAQAQKVADECKVEAERVGNPDMKNGTNLLMVMLAVKKGEYDKGLEISAKLPPGVDRAYAEWEVYAGKGDKDAASKAKEKILNWNSNSLGFVIFRKMVQSDMKW